MAVIGAFGQAERETMLERQRDGIGKGACTSKPLIAEAGPCRRRWIAGHARLGAATPLS
jgi:hypothetical protein